MKFMVEKTTIEYIKKPKAKHGRLIQGLLGVGQVGLMAGRQLIDSLGAEKIANIYSVDFLYPNVALPGIVYEDENLVDLHKDEIYYDEKNEIFILTGIYQGTTPESYYNLAHAILKFCEEVGVKEIYTLGGWLRLAGEIQVAPRLLKVKPDIPLPPRALETARGAEH